MLPPVPVEILNEEGEGQDSLLQAWNGMERPEILYETTYGGWVGPRSPPRGRLTGESRTGDGVPDWKDTPHYEQRAAERQAGRQKVEEQRALEAEEAAQLEERLGRESWRMLRAGFKSHRDKVREEVHEESAAPRPTNSPGQLTARDLGVETPEAGQAKKVPNPMSVEDENSPSKGQTRKRLARSDGAAHGGRSRGPRDDRQGLRSRASNSLGPSTKGKSKKAMLFARAKRDIGKLRGAAG